MRFSAGQVPNEPRVNRAEREFAFFGARASAGHVVEQPFQFGAGKVRIEYEAGFLLNERGFAVGFKLVTQTSRAPVLPHDSIGDGLAGGAIPEHRGFTLVGDADSGDVARADARFGDSREQYLMLRRPNLVGVVLDPTGLRKVLAKLFLRGGNGAACVVVDDCPRAGSALIERQDVLYAVHNTSLCRRNPLFADVPASLHCTTKAISAALESLSQHSLQGRSARLRCEGL